MNIRNASARAAALTAFILMTPAAAQETTTPHSAQEAASAAGSAEIESLRRDVRELRDLVRALQEQIRAVTAAGAASAAPTPTEKPFAAAPAPLPVEPPPVTAAPPIAVAAAPSRSQSLLNPAISGVFQAIGNTSVRRAYEENGFDLSEAEVAFQSVVDPYAKVDLFLSFPNGETPEVEEGFLTTLALPGSLQLRAGRLKSSFGKWNTLHTHAFFSVDRPDALTNFFGEESLTADGVSLSVLVPNPWDLYIDSITEIGTALEGTSFNSTRRNLTYVEHLAALFDTSPNSTLEVGLTAARGRSGPTETLIEDLSQPGVPATLSPRERMDSAVQGLDVTYKWKPLRLNVYRSFLWQTELIRGHRHVEILTPSLTLAQGAVTSLGGYSYVESQFVKRWRVGARYDWSGLPDSETAREWAVSGVVRFQPSEFQEIRFQLKRTHWNDDAALRFSGDEDDTRVFFEWIPVIGAHGAHKY